MAMLDEGEATLRAHWDHIVDALHRVDRVPLRREVRRRLRPDGSVRAGARSSGDVAADPLRVWMRMGQAMVPGHERPLEALLQTQGLAPASVGGDEQLGTWPVWAAAVIEGLFRHVPAEDQKRSRSTGRSSSVVAHTRGSWTSARTTSERPSAQSPCSSAIIRCPMPCPRHSGRTAR